jgi:uncharacterized membrane protein YjjP (DUF1212 family)
MPMNASYRTPLFRVVGVVFGVALLAAAVLKLVYPGGLVASPVTDALPAWAQGLVPVFEVGLGGWLVSGLARFGAWAVAVPTAALFALHSLALAADSQPSCGCLGELKVPPAVTLGFDLVVLALLLRSRPRWAGWPVGPAVRAVAVAGLLLVGSVVLASARYGSVTAALAAAWGEPVALTPDRLTLGLVPAGGTVERSLRVTNLSADPVQVVLAESNCSCVAVSGLPATVAPGDWADLPVTVTVSTTPGLFQRKARLRTSAGDLNYAVTASVTAGPRHPGTPPGPDAKEVRP